MVNHNGKLLEEIQRAAMDGGSSLPDALRKCLLLGGIIGSEALRTWASTELKGYPNQDEIPDYRIVPGLIAIDGVSGNYKVTGQQISASSLPDPADKFITNDVKFGVPIAEIVDLAKSARAKGGVVDIALPGNADLCRLMNYESESQCQFVERVYWRVAATSIAKIPDVVHTTLLELVAEMRAATGDDPTTLTRAAVEQAVNVAVHGDKNRIVFGPVAQAAGGDVTVPIDPAPKEGFFRRFFWYLVGAATVAGAAATILGIWITNR